jgi:hypothetical protein
MKKSKIEGFLMSILFLSNYDRGRLRTYNFGAIEEILILKKKKKHRLNS